MPTTREQEEKPDVLNILVRTTFELHCFLQCCYISYIRYQVSGCQVFCTWYSDVRSKSQVIIVFAGLEMPGLTYLISDIRPEISA